jgi:hypothetical protein
LLLVVVEVAAVDDVGQDMDEAEEEVLQRKLRGAAST